MKTATKIIPKSNGSTSEEEKATLLLQEKDKEKQEKFLHEYRMLCQKYGMSLQPQIHMAIKR